MVSNHVSVRLMVWAAALCPVMLAVVFHTGLRPVPLAIEKPRLPALAFAQYGVDRQKVNPASMVEVYYQFHNRGTEPVQILSIEKSCDCLETQLHGARDKIIQPGAQGAIIVQMRPGNVTPGPHMYFLNVKYTDPEPREVALMLKAEIPATLWVQPMFLSFFHPRGAEPSLAEFTVTDGRSKRFEVTDVSIDTDLVETAIGETTRTPQGNFQQKVNIRVAGTLPPEMRQHIMKIKTTDPEYPELRVTLRLHGAPLPESDPIEAALDHEKKAE